MALAAPRPSSCALWPKFNIDSYKLNTGDAAIGLIEDVPNFAPEFSVVPARPRAGTSYKCTRRIGYPKGSFRGINTGTPITSMPPGSEWASNTVTL